MNETQAVVRALVCRAFGTLDALAVEAVDVPKPGPGQLRIEVHAAGLGHADALTVRGHYQVKPPRPFVPGAEMAGIVSGVGDGVERFRRGDRVIATGLGAFAEACIVDARRALPLPEGIDFDDGAVLSLSYGTALHALQERAQLQPGETLLVLGAAGGVGCASLEIGRALGAYVIAAASSADKLALCRRLGADETIDVGTDELRARIDALTDGRGVDVVCDPVGGALGEAALRCLAWRGRLATVGFASGALPSYSGQHLLLRERAVVGVYLGDSIAGDPLSQRARTLRILDWHARGELHPPISARVSLEQAPVAMARLLDRRALGKTVVHPAA